jgi:SpoVK/Ycf46/Vps4 family AAA+-type ATPase
LITYISLRHITGSGKTLLARAVANQCQTTFFNISASSIISKYRGESEKLVRTLFEMARYYAPSTIFMDEIDSLLSHRSTGGGVGGGIAGGGNGGEQEHESSRRVKTELLTQLDGLASDNSNVFILCATNLPWQLDPAFLRRLEKRIYIPLPSTHARLQMIEKHLPVNIRAHSSFEYQKCAEATSNFSGADIYSLCKETAMRPVRKKMKELAKLMVSQSNSKSKSAPASTSLFASSSISPTPSTQHIHMHMHMQKMTDEKTNHSNNDTVKSVYKSRSQPVINLISIRTSYPRSRLTICLDYVNHKDDKLVYET